MTAESSGGAIQVNAANGVQCDSAGGAIRLRNVVGALHASTNAGSISAELVAGHRIQDSVLSTHAGDITVFIPSNFAVTVVARNGSSGSSGPDRLGFSGDSCSNGRPAWGAPVVAEGALNGGGPVLHINVDRRHDLFATGRSRAEVIFMKAVLLGDGFLCVAIFAAGARRAILGFLSGGSAGDPASRAAWEAAYLGVSLAEIDSKRAAELKLKEPTA